MAAQHVPSYFVNKAAIFDRAVGESLRLFSLAVVRWPLTEGREQMTVDSMTVKIIGRWPWFVGR
jgi:hypothetical protein